MGKKRKKNQKGSQNVANAEALQRMNFLYQAAFLMVTRHDREHEEHGRGGPGSVARAPAPGAARCPPLGAEVVGGAAAGRETRAAADAGPSPRRKRKARGAGRGSGGSLLGLGRFYAHTMKTVGKRLVLRSDPHVKRSLCRRCETPLLAAVTSETRLQRKPEAAVVTSCTQCGASKRLVASKPAYTLWSDRPDVVVRPADDEAGEDDDSSAQQHQNHPQPHGQKQNQPGADARRSARDSSRKKEKHAPDGARRPCPGGEKGAGASTAQKVPAQAPPGAAA